MTIRRGEIIPSDACGREAQARRAVFVFAVKWADERFERTAVAHFQSAWYHSLMASSLIRDETGLSFTACPHSPSTPILVQGASPVSYCAAARLASVQYVLRCVCPHQDSRQGSVLFTKNMLRHLWFGFRRKGTPQWAFLKKKKDCEEERAENKVNPQTASSLHTLYKSISLPLW